MPKQYARFINWNLHLDNFDSAYDAFSDKRASRIRKSLEILEKSQFHFEFHELNESLLDRFVIIYNMFMSEKKGGIIYPIKDKISAKQQNGRKYHILALWENDLLIGGLVFSERKSSVSIAYRVLPVNINLGMKSSPAQIAEYLITDFTLNQGKKTINHGRDRNAFGINADIGLASFKMRVGATPYISKNNNEMVEMPETFDRDVLICLGEDYGEKCDEFVLFTDLDEIEALDKYQIGKYNIIPIRVEKR